MRFFASLVLAAAAAIAVTSGARAEAPAEWRVCVDNATAPAQRLAACSAVITTAPPAESRELARVYFLRGTAHSALGTYDRALADFDAATKVSPTSNAPFNSRGHVFVRLKQYDRALAEFDQAVRLSPNDPNSLTNRGEAYREKGRFDRALQDYDAAIAINPKWVGAYFGRALTMQQKAGADFDAFVNEGRYEELAIAEYNRVLQIAPRHAGALNNRAQLYHVLRKYDLAIADYTKASELAPTNPLVLRNRALTYRMMRRFDLAIADYRSALAVTQDAAGRKLLGELLAELGVTV